MSRVSSNGDVGKVEDSGGGFILFGDGFLGAHLNYDGKMKCNSFTQCSSFESYQTTSDLTSAWFLNRGNTSSACNSGWGIVHICLP